jgi:hypothetical protein
VIRRRILPVLARILLVIAAGLVLGAATSWLQFLLPTELKPFANSNGGWTMLTFLVVWLVRSRPLLGALLGVLAFQALNEGYGLMSAARGFFYAEPFSNVYTLLGIPAGLLFGAIAGVVRFGRPEARVLGTAVLSALLLADGLWLLIRVGESTGPHYWVIQMALGAAFLALAVVRARPRWWAVAASVGVIAVSLAVYPLLLDLVFGV